jgi:hypothetical protein
MAHLLLTTKQNAIERLCSLAFYINNFFGAAIISRVGDQALTSKQEKNDSDDIFPANSDSSMNEQI